MDAFDTRVGECVLCFKRHDSAENTPLRLPLCMLCYVTLSHCYHRRMKADILVQVQQPVTLRRMG